MKRGRRDIIVYFKQNKQKHGIIKRFYNTLATVLAADELCDGDATCVKEVFANDSELLEIPEIIYTFVNLESLYLSSNRIQCIPRRLFKSLPNLNYLNIYNNAIRYISTEAKQLKTLTLAGSHGTISTGILEPFQGVDRAILATLCVIWCRCVIPKDVMKLIAVKLWETRYDGCWE
jgi:hypothetical protein